MEAKGYHKLIVHQKADALVFEIYKLTNTFPKEEMFGLISQMRGAAVSVAANIAEGYMRQGTKDKVRFFNLAQGSLVELEYFLEFSEKLKYITKEEFNKIYPLKDEVGKLLNGYIKVLMNSGDRKLEAGA